MVSNPPYSQNWEPPEPGEDIRFEYGIAPKSKADYAFLLHDLYHLRDDGIMTIVLPHGVLFRGGEEGTIRRNLVEPPYSGHHRTASEHLLWHGHSHYRDGAAQAPQR